MKRLLVWSAAVIALVILADIFFGKGARYYINNYTLKGDYRASDHLIKDSVEELIVLGSSVGLNDIDTRMLADSLNISAYNGGSNGQEFPYYLTLMEIIADKPGLKTVILGLKEVSLTNTGSGKRYNFLMPYYKNGHDGIDRRIEGDSKLDKILLKSSLYRYNTIWFRILLYSVYEPGVLGDCGFIAKDIPAFFPSKIPDEEDDAVTEERDLEFRQFVKLCQERGIRLIVCVPPRYVARTSVSKAEKYLREHQSRGEYELWFDPYDTPLSQDSTLFYDNEHLNYDGAKEYTRQLTNRLRNYNNKNEN